jgi:hypothetical protein
MAWSGMETYFCTIGLNMYALIQNNAVTQVGELSILFPNTSNPNHAFAIEQGALEVVEGEQKDQRFYWVTFDSYQVNGSVVTRTYTNTPKALEDVTETVGEQTSITQGLKSQWIAQNKASANSQLAQTDWMVIRKAERNIEIPADIAAERIKLVVECNAKEAAIIAATTMEEFLAVVAPINTQEP